MLYYSFLLLEPLNAGYFVDYNNGADVFIRSLRFLDQKVLFGRCGVVSCPLVLVFISSNMRSSRVAVSSSDYLPPTAPQS